MSKQRDRKLLLVGTSKGHCAGDSGMRGKSPRSNARSQRRTTTAFLAAAVGIVVVAALVCVPVESFQQPFGARRPGIWGNGGGLLLRPGSQHHRRMSSAKAGPETTAEEAVESIGRKQAADKPAALTALEKLRKRQLVELEETDRLIELLSSGKPDVQVGEALLQSVNGKHRQSDSSGGGTNSTDLSGTLTAAASALYGFDYGFKSRSEGAPSKLQGSMGSLSLFDGVYQGPPGNVLLIGFQQFFRNLNAMRGEYNDEEEAHLTPQQVKYRNMLDGLSLNASAIWERELKDGPIDAPLLIKVPYLAVCYLLDVVFEGRYVPSRFLLLETVARMPYFSYMTMLHLYETLGFWRRSAEVKRIHFAEELNEYRHLLIMESLGGDQPYFVRFLAQHSAIAYFVILCLLWLVSPSLSYRFSELLETHAVNTYGVFLDENEEVLRKLPPSLAAVEYYCFGSSDPFYAEFQTSSLATGDEIRRPGDNLRSLYDVFQAIREDEGDHVKTMQACLDPSANLRAPSLEKKALTGAGLIYLLASYLTVGGEGSELAAGLGLDMESLPSLQNIFDLF